MWMNDGEILVNALRQTRNMNKIEIGIDVRQTYGYRTSTNETTPQDHGKRNVDFYYK